ncbi:hypothetical protein Tco_0454747 [Tanacetum coccineum]
MKSQQSTNTFVKETFIDLKTVAKNHQASIQNLETKFDKLADKQSGRPSGSLPSSTQPNPKVHNSKAYQPPQSCNEHVNAVFTRSVKSYDPPDNPNNQQNNPDTPINFDNNDEDDEPTPQPKTQNLKPVKETHSDIESEYDMPVCADFMTFSNPLFDSNDDFTSSDDESLSDEDIRIPLKCEKSDLIDSLLNRDTFDIDFDPEEEIHLVKKLLYDNSSPRPPEELNSENSDAVIESFSPSPIPVKDSDSLMEEILIFLAPDDSIPLSIENDDYDSEGYILFLEELLSNDSLSLPENESFHFDRYYDPSSPRPPAKPPDDDGIHFDIEPDMGILTAKVVDDISEHYVLMPSILPTHPTRCPVIDTLLPFSSENENKIAPDFEDSRARGFVLCSLELQHIKFTVQNGGEEGGDQDGDDGEDKGRRLIGEDDGYHGGEEGLTMEKTIEIGEDTNSV